MLQKDQDIYFIGALLVAVLLLYGNSISGGFIWDDRAAVIGNPDVHGNPSLSDILNHDFWGQDIKQPDSHKSYRPLTVATFRLNFLLHGFHANSYHVFNVALYGIAVVVFYFLSDQVLENSAARVSTVLFLVHPIHVESVASIVGRADCLCGIFYMLSLIAYRKAAYNALDYRESLVWAGLAIGSALGASLAKEIGVTVFGVLMVIEVLAKIDVSNRKNHAQKKQFSIQKLRTGQLKGLESTNSFLSIWNYVRVFWCKLKDISIVFLELFNDWSSRLRLASVLVSLIIFMIFRLRINGENSLYQWTKMENHIHLLPNFFHRSLSYAQMHFWYLFKLIYPRHLCFDYGYSCIPIVTTMVDCRNLMPLSMYLTIGIMFTYGVATADTIVLFSLSILLIALVPTLQILFPVGTLLAERLLFVPSIGFCMLSGYFAVSKMPEFWIAADDSICAAINYFAAKYTEKLERTRSTTSKATIEVFDNAHITETTPRTSPAQKKKVTFSENKKEKSKMTVNRIVLPDIVSSEQQKPFILKQLPLSSKYFALAILVSLLSFRVVTRNGDWQSEYGLYSSALQVCPLSVKALTNFAVLASSNKSEENLRNVVLPAAIAGVSIHSRNVATLINAGVAYDNLGEYSRSIHLFQRALKEVPSHSKALANLGTSEYRWSLIVEDKIARSLLKVQAIQHLESSIANGWSYPSSLHMLGSAYLEINEILKGISYLEEALKVSSYNKDMRRGSSDVPVADDINWACTYNQLGNAYRAAGDMEAAIKSFHLGLRIQPDVYQIHTNLGSLYREMGRIDEARRVLEEGIRITIPKTPAALSNNLGLLELDEGNLQRAWDLFSSALNNAGIGYDSSVLPDSPGADESIQSIILNNLEKVKSAMNSRR